MKKVMHHAYRFSLAIAVIAASAQVCLPTRILAQPRLVEGAKLREFALPPAQVESIDAETRTVSLRGVKIAPGTAPVVTAEGATQVQLVKGELEIVPLSVGAPIVRVEPALASDALKIGDIVSLLGQKIAPGQVRIQEGNAEPNVMQREAFKLPLSSNFRQMGSARYGSKAEFFRVVSLNPLTLRKGGEPAVGNEEKVLSVPFTNGPHSLPIGTLSVGTIEAGIMLKLGRGNLLNSSADSSRVNKDLRRYVPINDPKTSTDFPVITENYVVTLQLTQVDGLEFDRFSALRLSDVAADLALGKVSLTPEFGQTPDGKREITRLIVSAIK